MARRKTHGNKPQPHASASPVETSAFASMQRALIANLTDAANLCGSLYHFLRCRRQLDFSGHAWRGSCWVHVLGLCANIVIVQLQTRLGRSESPSEIANPNSVVMITLIVATLTAVAAFAIGMPSGLPLYP